MSFLLLMSDGEDGAQKSIDDFLVRSKRRVNFGLHRDQHDVEHWSGMTYLHVWVFIDRGRLGLGLQNQSGYLGGLRATTRNNTVELIKRERTIDVWSLVKLWQR
jgi:hypothetical protein